MMDWITKAVFYHIYPLGFCGAPRFNADGERINRIEKLVDWIPHLKELGVNAVYLGPVFESSEHGYDTKDYYQIDKRLGDSHAFRTVCGRLHESGIRVVLDGVFNHVGREFWAFRDVQQNGRGSRYCGWFHNLSFGGGSPMGDPFWYDAWEGHFNLVKLNLKNPEVVDHLLGAVGSWIQDFGIDGLRLDAADCVDPDFFRRLRSFCKEKKPDFWLMGEIIHGDYNRWANPEMLDSVTNYECYKGIYSSHNDKNYFEIAYSLNRQFGDGGIYKNIYTYNFVDNHDVNRLASVLRNPEHLENVYTLLFTMPGAPSVYYGSEWGLPGIKENGSDWPLRPCLDLHSLPPVNGKLSRHIAKLSRLKEMCVPLQTGDYRQIVVKNEQLVYRREAGGQALFTALNLADRPASLGFGVTPGKVLVDVLNHHQVFSSVNGSVELPVEPYSARVLLERDASEIHLPETVDFAAPPISPQEVKPGLYRHFKGHEYEVLGVARHTETMEPLVVYRDPQDHQKLWARPLSMFLETVNAGGRCQPRFQKL